MNKKINEVLELLTKRDLESFKVKANEYRIIALDGHGQSKIINIDGDDAYLKRILLTPNERMCPIILMSVGINTTIKAKLGFDINTKDVTFRRLAYKIWAALTADKKGYYGIPFDNLILLENDIDDFDQAVIDLREKKIPAAAKNGAKAALKKTLDLALAYINSLAKERTDLAEAIIEDACMKVIIRNGIRKDHIKVKKLMAVGEYKLTTKAAIIDDKRVDAIYYWQSAILVDNKKVWTNMDETMVANTIAKNVSNLVKTWFRGRFKTKKGGMTPWYYDDSE